MLCACMVWKIMNHALELCVCWYAGMMHMLVFLRSRAHVKACSCRRVFEYNSGVMHACGREQKREGQCWRGRGPVSVIAVHSCVAVCVSVWWVPVYGLASYLHLCRCLCRHFWNESLSVHSKPLSVCSMLMQKLHACLPGCMTIPLVIFSSPIVSLLHSCANSGRIKKNGS